LPLIEHIIIGMPPQHIIMGIPAPHMAIMRSQHSRNMSMDMPSIGIISQVMPVLVMLQVIFAIIIGIGIMPIGIIPPIMGIMPFIMGIMPFITGIPPIIGIGIGIMAGIAVMGLVRRLEGRSVTPPMTAVYSPARAAQCPTEPLRSFPLLRRNRLRFRG
jgi:hypothetical protein